MAVDRLDIAEFMERLNPVGLNILPPVGETYHSGGCW
jgi:hypothetical protein